jgi:hypothetical protein
MTSKIRKTIYIFLMLRAYPNNPLASIGCAAHSRRQAASTTNKVSCFAFLGYRRLAQFRADE